MTNLDKPFGGIRKVETAEEKAARLEEEGIAKEAAELGMSVKTYKEHLKIKAETKRMGDALKAEEERDKNREIKDLN